MLPIRNSALERQRVQHAKLFFSLHLVFQGKHHVASLYAKHGELEPGAPCWCDTADPVPDEPYRRVRTEESAST